MTLLLGPVLSPVEPGIKVLKPMGYGSWAASVFLTSRVTVNCQEEQCLPKMPPGLWCRLSHPPVPEEEAFSTSLTGLPYRACMWRWVGECAHFLGSWALSDSWWDVGWDL